MAVPGEADCDQASSSSDEAGHRPIAFSGAPEEGLELLANHGVQRDLFRPASEGGVYQIGEVKARS